MALDHSIRYILLNVLLLSTRCRAGAIAAWYSGNGAPQVVMQDDSTGQVFYSLCNSSDVPIFPDDLSNNWTGPADYSISGNTNLGIAGWHQDGIRNTTIWSQNDSGEPIAAPVICNASGYYEPVDDDPYDTGFRGINIHPKSTFAVLDFGREVGYKVFYKYDDLSLHVAGPHHGLDDSSVSQDRLIQSGFNLAACITDNGENITVVTARDDLSIEVATLQPGQAWVITTFPTPLGLINGTKPVTNSTDEQLIQYNVTLFQIPLPSWDGYVGDLGVTYHSNGKRSIFFIGTNKYLQQYSDVRPGPNSGDWSEVQGQNESIWPRADETPARFGFASDPATDQIWIYYMSGGGLTQIHMSGVDNSTGQGIWEQPVRLTNLSTSAEVPMSEGTPEPTPSGQSDSPLLKGGLSTGSKAGIGVGVPIGVAAFIAVGYTMWKKFRPRETVEPEGPSNIHELENEPKPREEMPAEEYSHELEQPQAAQEARESQQVYEMPAEPTQRNAS
ncbi:hypothetical protein F4779DRAFT_593428 [Xylariaceae sp. FL0662B]|nr:hypothetical protein F4779DRAFT_593428 [Xylariaceae sp. FL0662B]